jgi:hypothetical protein
VTRLLLAPACAFVLLLASRAPASGSHGFEGRVLDATGKPVAGAWIETRPTGRGALDADDFLAAPTQSMRTSNSGEWSIGGMGEGNWIITAVASSTPRTDVELQDLARPRSEPLPAGVAVARLFRHFDSGDEDIVELLDLGLAVGSASDRPVAGKLSGAFDPGRYGYQVTVTPNRAQMAGSGTTTVVISGGPGGIGGDSFAFSTVPAADGSFDLGGLDPGDYDLLEVEVCLLDGAESARCAVYSAPVVKLDRTQRSDVPVKSAALVHVRVTGAATPPQARGGGSMTVGTGGGFDADSGWAVSWWGEGRGNSRNEYGLPDSCDMFLPAGSYLFQASAGELASPHVLCRVDPAAETAVIELEVKPCPSFSVMLVDAKGKALPDTWVRLTTAEHAAVAPDCRIDVLCRTGQLRLDRVFPGAYDAEFSLKGHEPFRLPLELKSGASPITVAAP